MIGGRSGILFVARRDFRALSPWAKEDLRMTTNVIDALVTTPAWSS
jgi:hypothetical protein